MSRDRDRSRERDRYDRDRRSLDRGDDRDRGDYRDREYRRGEGRYSRERDRNERTFRDARDDPQRLISSTEPELLSKRVFIGNLATDRLSKPELQDMFDRYGKVLAVAIYKGYGFVQFEREDEARKSVAQEHGGMIKGQRVDVRMAAEGKKRKEDFQKGGGFRDRSPIRRDFPPYRDPYGPPPYGPRDPYEDPYRRGPPPPPPPHHRDPYYDPYARDPYREPYPPPPPHPGVAPPPPHAYVPPPPSSAPLDRPAIDCEILIVGRAVREYAEGIERRLKSCGMLSYINTLGEDAALARIIEEVGRRGILYAISINSQNELHRSITVTILHGAPQEHRNMPLDDALALIQRNFEEYSKTARPQASTGSSNPEEILSPDQKTSYLLNLLADNRFLTIAELDHVLHYLTERRKRLLEKQNGTSGKDLEEEVMARKQKELQAKILSVLGDNAVSGAPTASTPVGAPVPYPNQIQGAPPAGNFTPTSLMENPNVQQALDNLISSPNLLRSITAVSPSGVGSSGQHPVMTVPGHQYAGFQ